MFKRMIHITFVLVLVAVTPMSATASGSADNWWGLLGILNEDWGAGFYFGVRPGFTDGYDGQPAANMQFAGVRMALYRTWGGSPAFYNHDYESPIPAGGSKTWSDIWLWSQNYTPVLGNRTYICYNGEPLAPSGYWGRLSLDYVPSSLGWTGPWYFDFPLDGGTSGTTVLVPVPITNNPYDPMQVTRMHLTVYTTPIPEPSSLLALGGGLLGLVGLLRRRSKQ